MKKILLILLATTMLCSCAPSSPVDKSGRLIAEKYKNNTFMLVDEGMQVCFKYVVIDGHEYLISTYDRGIGVTHSPKCSKCKLFK